MHPYTRETGRIRALARLHAIELEVQEQAKHVSTAERNRLVKRGGHQILEIREQHRQEKTSLANR
ncbi:MAG: hypothetical protein R3B83_02625 [Nitrospirales bacterium]|nr:hypothetical protein [Nitrospirales bacterium]